MLCEAGLWLMVLRYAAPIGEGTPKGGRPASYFRSGCFPGHSGKTQLMLA